MLLEKLRALGAKYSLSATELSNGLTQAIRGELAPTEALARELLIPLAWITFRFLPESNPSARVAIPLRFIILSRGESSLDDLIDDIEVFVRGDPTELAELAFDPIEPVMAEIEEARRWPSLRDREAPLHAVLEVIETGQPSEDHSAPAEAGVELYERALAMPDESAEGLALLVDALAAGLEHPSYAYRAIGVRCWKVGFLDRADRALGLCLAYEPGNHEVRGARFGVRCARRDLDGALRDARRCLALGGPRAHQMLALVHASRGELDEALVAAEGHVAANAFSDTELVRAIVRELRGEHELAMRDYDRVIAKYSHCVEARASRAVSRARSGDVRGGLEDLQWVLLREDLRPQLADLMTAPLWRAPFTTLAEAERWRGQLLASLLPDEPSLSSARQHLCANQVESALDALAELMDTGPREMRAVAKAAAIVLLPLLGNDPALHESLRRVRRLLR
jgi:tetratricopeptide (TPR) repeat protein